MSKIEDPPPWELCGTTEEKERNAVFTVYRSVMKGFPLAPELVGHCVDTNYERFKSATMNLPRDTIVRICTETLSTGWFEPNSAARAYFDSLEQNMVDSGEMEPTKTHGAKEVLDAVMQEAPEVAEVSKVPDFIEKPATALTVDPKLDSRKSQGNIFDSTNIIEISDDDSDIEEISPPRHFHRKGKNVANTTRLLDDTPEQREKAQSRVDRSSGRVQKPNLKKDEGAVSARTRSKASGEGTASTQARSKDNQNGVSGKGALPRLGPHNKTGTGIASRQSLRMSAIERPGGRPLRSSLGGYCEYITRPDLPILPFKLQHTILTSLQTALEIVCFRFAQKWLPMILEQNRFDTPEAIEWNTWWSCLRDCSVPVEAVKYSDGLHLGALFERLKHVRHCAVHRVPNIPVKCIGWMVTDAMTFSETLGDNSLNERFKSWRDTLGDYLDHVRDAEKQAPKSAAEKNLEFIKNQRREASGKLQDVEQDIKVLQEDLQKLFKKHDAAKQRYSLLCGQEDEAFRGHSAFLEETRRPLKLDAESSRSFEERFALSIEAGATPQPEPGHTLSGRQIFIRDIGTKTHRDGKSHGLGADDHAARVAGERKVESSRRRGVPEFAYVERLVKENHPELVPTEDVCNTPHASKETGDGTVETTVLNGHAKQSVAIDLTTGESSKTTNPFPKAQAPSDSVSTGSTNIPAKTPAFPHLTSEEHASITSVSITNSYGGVNHPTGDNQQQQNQSPSWTAKQDLLAQSSAVFDVLRTTSRGFNAIRTPEPSSNSSNISPFANAVSKLHETQPAKPGTGQARASSEIRPVFGTPTPLRTTFSKVPFGLLQSTPEIPMSQSSSSVQGSLGNGGSAEHAVFGDVSMVVNQAALHTSPEEIGKIAGEVSKTTLEKKKEKDFMLSGVLAAPSTHGLVSDRLQSGLTLPGNPTTQNSERNEDFSGIGMVSSTDARKPSEEGRRVHIGNLAYATTEEELQDFFKGHPIESSRIVTHPVTGRLTGYGFATLCTPEAAKRAVQELSGQLLLGQEVSVQLTLRLEIYEKNKEQIVVNAAKDKHEIRSIESGTSPELAIHIPQKRFREASLTPEPVDMAVIKQETFGSHAESDVGVAHEKLENKQSKKHTKKKRKSELKTVAETILSGVPEGFHDEDFVSLA